jgi:hypothetical protein
VEVPDWIAAESKTSWHVLRGVLFSGVVGGLYLWVAMIVGAPAPGSMLFFCIAIPVMMAISAAVVFALILPLAVLLHNVRLLNPVSLTVCGALGGMWVLLFLSRNELLPSDAYRWFGWGVIWMSCMALTFARSALPRQSLNGANKGASHDAL